MVACRKSLEKDCGRPQITRRNDFKFVNFLARGGADRRLIIGGFTVPVADVSQIVISRWQTTHH
jgi:hypothetical protein